MKKRIVYNYYYENGRVEVLYGHLVDIREPDEFTSYKTYWISWDHEVGNMVYDYYEGDFDAEKHPWYEFKFVEGDECTNESSTLGIEA